MKVYISKSRYHWLSPYKILEHVMFWKDKIEYDDPFIRKWADRLSPFCEWLQSCLDFIHPKINYVKIDKYDVWSMDYTLALIILPMLKKLNANKQGAPYTNDEDVPDHLKRDNPNQDIWEADEKFFDRWEWIMGEMIFAFESKISDVDSYDQEVQNRVANGFRLFGKYYEALWD